MNSFMRVWDLRRFLCETTFGFWSKSLKDRSILRNSQLDGISFSTSVNCISIIMGKYYVNIIAREYSRIYVIISGKNMSGWLQPMLYIQRTLVSTPNICKWIHSVRMRMYTYSYYVGRFKNNNNTYKNFHIKIH